MMRDRKRMKNKSDELMRKRCDINSRKSDYLTHLSSNHQKIGRNTAHEKRKTTM
jgi:hypothetical protein